MKTFSVLVMLAFLQLANPFSHKEVHDSEWELFKAVYQKDYLSDEHEVLRRRVYVENIIKINTHNKEYAEGRHTYSMAVNQYADVLNEEFISKMNGFHSKMATQRNNSATFIGLHADFFDLPDTVDWRTKGAVTPVKDQGQCGSCWSFSAAGSLEAQHFRKTGNLVSLSEQNLVDCSWTFGNHGCNGGIMDLAFKYIILNHGIDRDDYYPYEGLNGLCRYNPAYRGATAFSYTILQRGKEEDMKWAVATVGPISVAIDASHQNFQFYSKGVYSEPFCSSTTLDHGVLVVGYGHDEASGLDYWLVKNSWATAWGDRGYVKMARNRNNMCGIATQASFPNV